MAPCIDTFRTCKLQVCHEDDSWFCYMNLFQPVQFPSRAPITTTCHSNSLDGGDVWLKMLEEAKSDVEQEPVLSSYYHASITSHPSLGSALANILSVKLSSLTLPSNTLFEMFISVLEESPEIVESVKQDLLAAKERDPACLSYVHCFLSFKGFLAWQAQRIAHKLWTPDRKILALLIQNREAFAIDFHPGAKIGKGILFDHTTGWWSEIRQWSD